MKPLVVLLAAFFVVVFAIKFIYGGYDIALSARIAMAIMLVFTAIGHFAFTEGMMMMVPSFIPFKKEMVYLTGFIEIAAAVGLLVPSLRIVTGWLLILFFLLLLPANIKAALEQVDYQKATLNGPGLSYLWFRIPLQVLFIVWVYISAIKF